MINLYFEFYSKWYIPRLECKLPKEGKNVNWHNSKPQSGNQTGKFSDPNCCLLEKTNNHFGIYTYLVNESDQILGDQIWVDLFYKPI